MNQHSPANSVTKHLSRVVNLKRPAVYVDLHVLSILWECELNEVVVDIRTEVTTLT